MSKADKPRLGKLRMSARLTAAGAVASAGILTLSGVSAPPDSNGARADAHPVQLAALPLPLPAPPGVLMANFINDQALTFVPVAPVVADPAGITTAAVRVVQPSGSPTQPIRATAELGIDPAISSQVVNDTALTSIDSVGDGDGTDDGIGKDILRVVVGTALVLAWIGTVYAFWYVVLPVLIVLWVIRRDTGNNLGNPLLGWLSGLGPEPAVAGTSTATVEENPATAPTLAGDPVLGDSAPDITARMGPADSARATYAGTPGVFAPGMKALRDDISRSLSALSPFRTDQGNKQVETDNSGSPTLLPSLKRLAPTSLTDGVKFTPANPRSARSDNQTGPMARVGAKVSDSVQQAVDNLEKTVRNATDGVTGGLKRLNRQKADSTTGPRGR